ncbi:hypothetical protein L2X99_01980 [Microbacterium sp. KUDC0406]|uniref:hypothetical protein n=1 Tax=Microbacterium sp. KUDC0406 TaxID=2909588 RepID=UPI001F3C0346|nr:hypothetical protein [Microbacterium sp. KUDC0406]UJP10486.1 hypothetical protein L2X99_01980 [Microbacterium sp. KUDC0406]
MPESTMKDKNYNLVCVLEASLRNAWTMQTYIEDAEFAEDAELAEWFRKIQHNSLKAGEQGKRMLRDRLAEPGEDH